MTTTQTPLEQKIEKWIDNYANTNGVLDSEEESHINQMSATFGVNKDSVKAAYRKLQKEWDSQ